MSEVGSLWENLQQARACDRPHLRRQLQKIQQLERAGKPADRSLERWQAELAASITLREQRLAQRPQIEYDPLLPIVERKDEIASTVAAHQVVVICGETGSGKSTQLPKICLELGRGIEGLIGHTQPRRIAARSIAARVAEELGSPLGQAVGFKIRFTDVTSPQTYIKLMTDGILLAETQCGGREQQFKGRKHRGKSGAHRPAQQLSLLEQYDTLIIDEAHERSLNIDFLLGYLRRILPARPDLRIIITSATLDVERFAEFFATAGKPAPIINVSGRTYPVEVRYRPPELLAEDDGEVDWQRTTADACEELCQEGPGDILIFMPTERDIRETARVLAGRRFSGEQVEVLPLFGRLSEGEQNAVFRPHKGRRIVVATNVAESSLTVPGIRYVVDPGLARISRFSPTSKVQRLPIEPISQASADQRKGRCGRVGPGICVRLYSAEDFAARDRFTPPEILRSNLAAVLLQMKSLGLGEIPEFPFLDPPPLTAIRGGLKTLFELGAIDAEEHLTPLGRTLSRLPADPRIGRMILAAADEQCLEEVLIVASALELRDPRDRPLDKQSAADEMHRRFEHPQSDFLSLIKLWDFFERLDAELSASKLRKACHQHFLSFNRMREWRDLHRQLREIVIESGLKPGPRRLPIFTEFTAPPTKSVGDDRPGAQHPTRTAGSQFEDGIHRALLTGLLSNVGLKTESGDYQGAGDQRFHLWPGSVVVRGKPRWVMAAELVETTRRFARMVAPVQPETIEQLAGHLVKRTHSEPHWHDKSQAAMAWEKVLLYGLPIVPRRRCRLAPLDPQKARELFIQHALVEGEYAQPKAPFYVHNLQFKEELKAWQAKLRQGSLFVGEEQEFAFYDERIPSEVVDGPSFEQWRKRVELQHPRLLFLTRQALNIEEGATSGLAAFPDHLTCGSMSLPVVYQLEPGTTDDGATLVVPQEGLAQLSARQLGWLVPGLLEEKVAALIKTLPKDLRTRFVPVPDTARELLPQLQYGEGELLQQLSEVLRRRCGEHIRPADFDLQRIPQHLLFNIRVVDHRGEVISCGRDLAELQRRIGQQASRALGQVAHAEWNRSGLTAWDFGELPREVTFERQGISLAGYPMLLDEGFQTGRASVALQLCDRPEVAERQTRLGLVRLFLLQEQSRLKEQLRWLPQLDQILLQAMAFPQLESFREQLLWRLAERCLSVVKEIPRNPGDWNRCVAHGKNQLSVAIQDVANLLGPLFQALRKVRKLISSQHPQVFEPLITQLSEQFEFLTGREFFLLTPWPWLQQYLRYCEAMQIRWNKAQQGGLARDSRLSEDVHRHWRRLQELESRVRRQHPQGWPYLPAPAIQNFRWLVEEYRVSVFAQQLKTAVPVSVKRLEEAWEKTREALG